MNEMIVSMEHISKSFPGVKALDDVHFELRAGEIMALLGENGAGKSTLMKILGGVYEKDAGTVRIFGKEYENLTPRLSKETGVAIIHQELTMCRHLTVAENIFLGRERKKGFILSNREMEEEAEKILGELNIELNPQKIVGDLSVSMQQMVEIAKALSANAKILVMDEPTSALTTKETFELFRIIRELKAKGCGIVYISHRLEELQHIVDRVTIMRDGQFITSMDYQSVTLDEMIAYMVGREIKEKFPRVICKQGRKILEVRKLQAGRLVRDISFDLHEGEIVGFAGLMGAGRTETTRTIFGACKKTGGEIFLEGKPVKITSPKDAILAGIVLVPEDRKRDGLCTKLSIRHNLALPNLRQIGNRFGVLNAQKERRLCEKMVKNLQIKTHSMEIAAGSLSGGNQQKIVVGKWLAGNSKVVMFDEPTRGIDVAAKVEIYHLMNQLKQQGIAILFVSSEMPEILGMADRILVMCDGRITGEVSAAEATQSEILKHATRFEQWYGGEE